MLHLATLLLLAVVGYVQAAEVFRNAQFQCGIPKNANTLLIVNGVDAKIADWPWHAAIRHHLGNQAEYVCGGTLISERFVLTAAHCTEGDDEDAEDPKMSVQLGVNAVGSPEGKTFTVEKIHRHSGYSAEKLKDDVALLELVEPVPFGDVILPACISRKTTIEPGKFGAVVGWGFTENDIPSTTLKLARLPVVDDLDCRRKEPHLYGRVLTKKLFCAGFTNGTSACNGDSGGGIVFERGDAWYLGGIVSFTRARDGGDTCLSTTYSVFTKLAPYLDWVEQVTRTDFSNEYGIEKIIDCSVPGQPNGNCVPVQQCRDLFDTLRSPQLTKENVANYRQKVCELRGVRRSVCCDPNQTERIPIHRNAALLPVDCGVARQRKPTTTAARASAPEFPWIALVSYSKATPDRDPYCTGSLINDRYVLTSASCLKTSANSILDSVRLGGPTVVQAGRCINQEDCVAPPVDIKAVLPFIIHPQAIKQFRDNDVALVRLQDKVQFSQSIQPVCLPIREDLRNHAATDFFLAMFERFVGIAGRPSLELYKTHSVFVEPEECEDRYQDFSYIHWVSDQAMCALAKGPNYVCTQPLGAPLVAMVPQGDTVRAVQYGLAMQTPDNCTIAQDIPKIYIPILLFVDWILENISK